MIRACELCGRPAVSWYAARRAARAAPPFRRRMRAPKVRKDHPLCPGCHSRTNQPNYLWERRPMYGVGEYVYAAEFNPARVYCGRVVSADRVGVCLLGPDDRVAFVPADRVFRTAEAATAEAARLAAEWEAVRGRAG